MIRKMLDVKLWQKRKIFVVETQIPQIIICVQQNLWKKI